MGKRHDGNPFLEFGIAFENFFNLQVQLIKLLSIITLLALIQIGVFASFH